MKLILSKSAMKTLNAVQPKLAATLLADFRVIAMDPFALYPNVIRMKGGDNEFRLRHGDWRALYVINEDADTMTVTIIDTRGGVYK